MNTPKNRNQTLTVYREQFILGCVMKFEFFKIEKHWLKNVASYSNQWFTVVSGPDFNQTHRQPYIWIHSWSVLLKLHSQWIICAAIKTSRHPFTCAAMHTHTLKPKFMDHFTESGFHGWWVSVCARTVNNRKLVVQLWQSGHLSPAENRNKSNNSTMNR